MDDKLVRVLLLDEALDGVSLAGSERVRGALSDGGAQTVLAHEAEVDDHSDGEGAVVTGSTSGAEAVSGVVGERVGVRDLVVVLGVGLEVVQEDMVGVSARGGVGDASLSWTATSEGDAVQDEGVLTVANRGGGEVGEGVPGDHHGRGGVVGHPVLERRERVLGLCARLVRARLRGRAPAERGDGGSAGKKECGS